MKVELLTLYSVQQRLIGKHINQYYSRGDIVPYYYDVDYTGRWKIVSTNENTPFI